MSDGLTSQDFLAYFKSLRSDGLQKYLNFCCPENTFVIQP